MLYFLVIVGWFCQSGLISSFWTEILNVGLRLTLLFRAHLVIWDVFVIMRRLCHSGVNFSFWDEFVILG